jgi:hypothetical protein
MRKTLAFYFHCELGETDGIVIRRVGRGSPADQAGLQRFDVVTAIDGKPVGLPRRSARGRLGEAAWRRGDAGGPRPRPQAAPRRAGATRQGCRVNSGESPARLGKAVLPASA